MEKSEFLFEKLDVYQKSLDLSIEVCKAMVKIPYKYAIIRDQFIGAVISVPLNIAEGSGRTSAKEKTNFYKIARGSSFECIPLLKILLKLDLLDEQTVSRWRELISEICRMLSGLIRYQKGR